MIDLAADDVPMPRLGRLQPFAQQHPPIWPLNHQTAADAGKVDAGTAHQAFGPVGASTDG